MTAPRAAASHDDRKVVLSPALRMLVQRGVERSFRKNTIVLHEGDSGDTMYVVLKGLAKAFSTDANGREITYGMIVPGDYFGEMSLDGGPRSASVMTMEPTTCSVITRAAVREYATERPEFALELLVQVIRRARLATEIARSIALLDVYSRVTAALEGEHGTASPESPVLITPITHQSIASRVGASREMVSRLLKDLEKGGYVELGVKRITLRKKLPARW